MINTYINYIVISYGRLYCNHSKRKKVITFKPPCQITGGIPLTVKAKSDEKTFTGGSMSQVYNYNSKRKFSTSATFKVPGL